MPAKGTFRLPIQRDSDCSGARKAYTKVWGHEWSHDDDYLRELAREVPEQHDLKDANGGQRCEWLLSLMRENDNTTKVQ